MRDPRIDPKRGDHTRTPCGYLFRILAASRGKVRYKDEEADMTVEVTLDEWRKWAADDQIERRAK